MDYGELVKHHARGQTAASMHLPCFVFVIDKTPQHNYGSNSLVLYVCFQYVVTAL
jgi:hypothetical protein